MTKMSWQKLKYLENEKSFQGEIKNIFKGLELSIIVSDLKSAHLKKQEKSIPLKLFN